MLSARVRGGSIGRFASAVAAALAVCCSGFPAFASDLNVQPISVHLKPNRTTDTITVENRGTEPVRLQVSGFAWDQDATGSMKLVPSSDLVFFPILITIEPGKKKSVRVGLQNMAPTTTEKTFRIFFEELPSLKSQLAPDTTGLALLSKFGIPVFLDPIRIAPKPQVTVKGLRNGVLTIAIANAGNAHYISTAVTVAGLDARGAQLFDRSEKGWYVLAHGEREYAEALDPKECAALHDVTIELKTTAGNTKQTMPVTPGSCGK